MKVITIGRSRDNDVCINDPYVGRHHCQIVQHNNGVYTIVDLNSTNGTFLNGKRVFGENQLQWYDIITIGHTNLPWRTYFSPTSQSKKSNALPVVLGCVGGVLLLALIIAFSVFGKGSAKEFAYMGDYPDVVSIDMIDGDGIPYAIEAIEGQVMVMFEETTSHKNAFEILKNNHAKIVAQLPNVHYYLVEVPRGKEGEFVSHMRKVPSVNFVYPNAIEEICSVDSYVLDNFNGNHGQRVVSMLKDGSEEMNVAIRDVGTENEKHINCNKAYEEAVKIIENLGKDESAIINMSFGPAFDKEIKNIGERRADYIKEYINHLNMWKNLVLINDDKDFVFVKSSGNEAKTNLESVLDLFRGTLTKEEIETFERHFILVSAKDGNSIYPNDVSPGYYDKLVTKVDISDIPWDGTSFSSPRVAGYIARAADAHGIKVTEVLKHVRTATEVNRDHIFTAQSLDAVIKIAQGNPNNVNEGHENNSPSVGSNHNPSMGENTGHSVPSSLVGTKWVASELYTTATYYDFINNHQVKWTYRTGGCGILSGALERVLDCYYDSKENEIVFLDNVLNPYRDGQTHLKYSSGQLYTTFSYDGKEYKKTEFERIK